MATTQNKTSFLIDIRQTKEYASFMQKIGWQTIQSRASNRLGSPALNIFIKKLPLLPFSIAKILHCKFLPAKAPRTKCGRIGRCEVLRAKAGQLIKLKKIIKKYKILFIKIQLFQLAGDQNTSKVSRLTPPRWRIDKFPTVPTKTIWIDLTKPENQLLIEMKAKTRYNLKLAQKDLKIKIIPGDQITNNLLTNFYQLWSKNKPFNWFFKPSFSELKYLVKSFGNKCFFIIIYSSFINHYPLASCLILTSSNMSFYWHNCSTKEGKKLFAPTLCVWQVILESKKRKLKIFDFEGIWDQRYPKLNQGWQGFSKFKQGFGGEEIEFSQPLFIRGW